LSNRKLETSLYRKVRKKYSHDCRGLAFRDVTVSVERLKTTIMYLVGASREINTTVVKL